MNGLEAVLFCWKKCILPQVDKSLKGACFLLIWAGNDLLIKQLPRIHFFFLWLLIRPSAKPLDFPRKLGAQSQKMESESESDYYVYRTYDLNMHDTKNTGRIYSLDAIFFAWSQITTALHARPNML